MSTFLAIVLIVAVVAVVYYVRKVMWMGVHATTRVANRKLFFRPEHEQGRQMVSAPVSVSIPTAVADVMREVTARVTTEPLPPALKAVVYESCLLYTSDAADE